MSVAERLFNEGLSEGEARGEAQGKAEGLSEGEIRIAQRTLYKLYVKKFSIDSKIEKQIQSIDNLEKLEDLIDQLLDTDGQLGSVEREELLKKLD